MRLGRFLGGHDSARPGDFIQIVCVMAEILDVAGQMLMDTFTLSWLNVVSVMKENIQMALLTSG